MREGQAHNKGENRGDQKNQHRGSFLLTQAKEIQIIPGKYLL